MSRTPQPRPYALDRLYSRSNRIVMVGLLVLFNASALWAAPPAPTEIERLIRQLGSEQFAEREVAMKQLEAAGAAALAPLSRAAANDDLEIRWRAESLLERIGPRFGESRCFVGHTAYVWSVVFSPDGRFLLSGSSDGTVRLWDVERGHQVRCFRGHPGPVMSVAFSPDGSHILSAGEEDATVRLWDVGTGAEVRRFAGNAYGVHGVTWSADGRRALTASLDRAALLWDVASGKVLGRAPSDPDAVSLLPDGRHILSYGRRGLRVCDAETGELVQAFQGDTRWIACLALSADGRRALSGSCRGPMRLWDVEHGWELCQLHSRHARGVDSVALSADGRRALSGGSDGTARLWDLQNGEEIRCLEQRGTVCSVAFSRDGHCGAFGTSEGVVRLWRLPR